MKHGLGFEAGTPGKGEARKKKKNKIKCFFLAGILSLEGEELPSALPPFLQLTNCLLRDRNWGGGGRVGKPKESTSRHKYNMDKS